LVDPDAPAGGVDVLAAGRAHRLRRPDNGRQLARLRLHRVRGGLLRPEGPCLATVHHAAEADDREVPAGPGYPPRGRQGPGRPGRQWLAVDRSWRSGLDAGPLPAVHSAFQGRIRYCQERLRPWPVRLVQRPQRLLPGLGPAGPRSGNGVQPLPPDRSRPDRFPDVRRGARSDRRAGLRLPASRAGGARARRGLFRFRCRASAAAATCRGTAMNRKLLASAATVPTAKLTAAVARALSRSCGTPRKVLKLERRPSDYRSSFALEELDVYLDDGTC